MNELKMQSECFLWAWNSYPKLRYSFWHTDNNSVNRITGARKKALGVVSGVSDFLLLYQGEMHCIELKSDIGKQTPNQLKFQKAIEKQKGKYYIVRSVNEFKELFTKIVSHGE